MADLPVSTGRPPPLEVPLEPNKNHDTTVDNMDIEGTHYPLRFNIRTKQQRGLFSLSSAVADLFLRIQAIDTSAKLSSLDGKTTLADTTVIPSGSDAFRALFPFNTFTPRGTNRTEMTVFLGLYTHKGITDTLRHTDMISYLKENNLWLSHHRHKSTQVSCLGLLFFRNPKTTLLETVTNECNTYLQASLDELHSTTTDTSTHPETLPYLEISRRTKLHNVHTPDRSNLYPESVIKYPVLELTCDTDSVELFLTLIQHNAFPRSLGQFVPSTLPTNLYYLTMLKHARSQIDFLTDFATIPLSGLSPTSLGELFDYEGVTSLGLDLLTTHPSGTNLSLEPTKHSNTTGFWFIITTHTDAPKIRQWIDTRLAHIVGNSAASKALSRNYTPGPRRTTRSHELSASISSALDTSSIPTRTKPSTYRFRPQRQLAISFDQFPPAQHKQTPRQHSAPKTYASAASLPVNPEDATVSTEKGTSASQSALTTLATKRIDDTLKQVLREKDHLASQLKKVQADAHTDRELNQKRWLEFETIITDRFAKAVASFAALLPDTATLKTEIHATIDQRITKVNDKLDATLSSLLNDITTRLTTRLAQQEDRIVKIITDNQDDPVHIPSPPRKHTKARHPPGPTTPAEYFNLSSNRPASKPAATSTLLGLPLPTPPPKDSCDL